MNTGKKGISPLIAWILILGLTVAIASIVSIWYTQKAKSMSEETFSGFETGVECSEANYNVIFDENCNAVIINTGHLKIVKIKLSTDKGDKEYDLNLLPRKKSETLGQFEEISAVLYIQPEDKLLACPKEQVYTCNK